MSTGELVLRFAGILLAIGIVALLVGWSGEPEPWRDKCGYAERYKAIFKPTCGCRVCAGKWRDRS